MKLHDMLAGGEVLVRRDDKSAFSEYKREYTEARGDEPPTARCYLECEEDVLFSIVFRRPRLWTGLDLLCTFHVDGRRSQSSLLTDSDMKVTNREIKALDADGCLMLERLKFGKLIVTEDEVDACKNQTVLENLGTIVVELSEGRSRRSPYQRAIPAEAAVAMGPIHEKDKKGLIGSSVKGGTRRPYITGSKTPYIFTALHSPERVEYRVIITYRTRDLLKATGVIEDPSPPRAQGLKRGRDRSESIELVTPRRVDDAVARRRKRVDELLRLLDESEDSTCGDGVTAQKQRVDDIIRILDDTEDVKPRRLPSSRLSSGSPGSSKHLAIDLTFD